MVPARSAIKRKLTVAGRPRPQLPSIVTKPFQCPEPMRTIVGFLVKLPVVTTKARRTTIVP